MKIRNKRILKNGTIAGYVYYPNEKKWKWRFISKMKGGTLSAGNIYRIKEGNHNINVEIVNVNKEHVTVKNLTEKGGGGGKNMIYDKTEFQKLIKLNNHLD